MTTLNDITAFIKSANAGASYLTFDIGFPDKASFDDAVKKKILNPAVVAKLYGIKAADVQIYDYEPANVIKVTIPRPVMSGGIEERDFDGTQQYAPFLDIEV